MRFLKPEAHGFFWDLAIPAATVACVPATALCMVLLSGCREPRSCSTTSNTSSGRDSSTRRAATLGFCGGQVAARPRWTSEDSQAQQQGSLGVLEAGDAPPHVQQHLSAGRVQPTRRLHLACTVATVSLASRIWLGSRPRTTAAPARSRRVRAEPGAAGLARPREAAPARSAARGWELRAAPRERMPRRGAVRKCSLHGLSRVIPASLGSFL